MLETCLTLRMRPCPGTLVMIFQREDRFLSTCPDYVLRGPSPFQGSFPHILEKEIPGHLFMSYPIIGLWKVFSVPMLWTNGRTCFLSAWHLSNAAENCRITHDPVWGPLKLYFNLEILSRHEGQ